MDTKTAIMNFKEILIYEINSSRWAPFISSNWGQKVAAWWFFRKASRKYDRAMKWEKRMQSMKTISVNVMAHGAAVRTLERHMPIFKANLDGDYTLFSPTDDSVNYPGMHCIHIGKKEHDGLSAMRRFRYILRHIADGPHERIALLEYDCLVFGGYPEIPAGHIAGIFFPEENRSWKGHQFPHPPLFMDKEAAQKLAKGFETIPMNAEAGMWDRALGWVIDFTGVPWVNLHDPRYGSAFSHNTIHPAHYEGAREMAKRAKYWHGVKDSETLQVILQAQKE